MGITNNAAFGSSKRNVYHRTFPGHPASEGSDFIKRYIRGIAHAAFPGASCYRMLHPEASEDFQVAVVHGDRNVKYNFASGIAQDLPETLVQVELIGG